MAQDILDWKKVKGQFVQKVHEVDVTKHVIFKMDGTKRALFDTSINYLHVQSMFDEKVLIVQRPPSTYNGLLEENKPLARFLVEVALPRDTTLVKLLAVELVSEGTRGASRQAIVEMQSYLQHLLCHDGGDDVSKADVARVLAKVKSVVTVPRSPMVEQVASTYRVVNCYELLFQEEFNKSAFVNALIIALQDMDERGGNAWTVPGTGTSARRAPLGYKHEDAYYYALVNAQHEVFQVVQRGTQFMLLSNTGFFEFVSTNTPHLVLSANARVYKGTEEHPATMARRPADSFEATSVAGMETPTAEAKRVSFMDSFKRLKRFSGNRANGKGSQVVVPATQEIVGGEPMTIYQDVKLCFVHKGTIKGLSYICPSCNTFYCAKCVKALKDKGEGCWVCGDRFWT